MKKSGMAIVKVNTFKGSEVTADVNGLMPIYLHPVAGNIPNRNVLSGTIAESLGMVEGNSYIAQWSYMGEGDYGPIVNWQTLSEEPLSTLDILRTQKEFFNGESGEIFDCEVFTKGVKASKIAREETPTPQEG